MKNTQKLITLTLALLIALAFMASCTILPSNETLGYETQNPVGASPTSDFDYVIQNNAVYIHGYNGEAINVVIPEVIENLPVTSIDNYAFDARADLISITLPKNLAFFGDNEIYECTSLNAIYVTEGNKNYKSVDGVLFSKDGAILVVYPVGKDTTEYVIPNGVLTIEHAAFACCERLVSVVIPDGVSIIGAYAFENCPSLTIYAAAESAPDGWAASWNDGRPVEWGYVE